MHFRVKCIILESNNEMDNNGMNFYMNNTITLIVLFI